MPALSLTETETPQSHTDISLLGPLEDSKLTPKAVVERLDKYIIGQADAKKAVAVAFRNRWRRCVASCSRPLPYAWGCKAHLSLPSVKLFEACFHARLPKHVYSKQTCMNRHHPAP
jgi:hypothetical protein